MNEFKAQMPREFVLATFTMSATDHVPQQVQLDKALANASFANWQLGRGAMVGQQPASLPSPPAYQTSYGNGFLRTRTALLQNNLHELDSGELVFFLRCDAGNGIRLHRIAQRDESLVLEDSGVQLRSCASYFRDPETCQAPSVVQVSGEKTLLLSSGAGDLVVAVTGGARPAVSAAIEGIKRDGITLPLVLAAAAPASGGGIEALAWTIQDKEGSTPGHVQVYSLLLSVEASQDSLSVALMSCNLLTKAAVPPHLAAIDPASGTIVLGIDPGDDLTTACTSPQHRAHVSRVEDDEDAPSPRTMAAAVERLKRFTAETEEEALSGGDPYVDVFAERSEPTAPATEADCDVLLFGRGAVAVGSPAPLQRWTCRPHKLLAARGALLGLGTDVDCSVVQVTASGSAPNPTVALQHRHTIPALAYIVEGKAQRKFVLLGRPGDPVAAVIVEAFKYAYVYLAAAPADANGSHLIIDMSLPEGGPGALGAALVPSSAGCKLLVLTADKLLVWDIRA